MKELTGYASVDNPQSRSSSFFEKNAIIPNTNIYTVLKLLSNKYIDSIAVDSLDLKVSYDQLIKDSVTISKSLKELGVKKGQIVSISMPNLYQALAAFFACNRIGCIASFLDPFASKEDVCNYLNEFESPIFINYAKDYEYNEYIKSNTNVKYIVTLKKESIGNIDLFSDYKITHNESFIDFNSLGSIANYQKSSLVLPHSKNEDALILFTSGTTGKPKSVLLTNENILAAEIFAKNTSHTENIKAQKTLVCVPFTYPYGLVTSALTSLLWGKESILAPDISKTTVAKYYRKEPNIIFGSPALLDLTMKNIPDNQDLSSVTHFISGGDFLTESHASRGYEFFEKHGAKVEIGNGFGNAETVSIASTPIGVPLKQSSAGKLLVGTKAIIIDPETKKEKKYGEEGLLCVSGKHVFKGYYNNDQLTKESKISINGNEFFITGTMGYIDEDGYFYVTGRQSRFYIMSSLNKVYCDKIQNIICSYDCIEDCAVVAVPDDEFLYVNKAFIVLKKEYQGITNVEDYLMGLFASPTNIGSIKTQLKDYELPSYIEIVDELPRKIGTDKINYEELSLMAASASNTRIRKK